jgi:hypothetical protein
MNAVLSAFVCLAGFSAGADEAQEQPRQKDNIISIVLSNFSEDKPFSAVVDFAEEDKKKLADLLNTKPLPLIGLGINIPPVQTKKMIGVTIYIHRKTEDGKVPEDACVIGSMTFKPKDGAVAPKGFIVSIGEELEEEVLAGRIDIMKKFVVTIVPIKKP